MKKYLSVFAMIARSTIYKNLFIILAVLGTQLYIFSQKAMELVKMHYDLEGIIYQLHLIWPLGVGYVLITVFLSLTGCNIGSKQGYTLRRLQISEKAVLGLQMIYNCISYVLLWGSQAALLVGICFWYVKNGTYLTSQTVVLAFYREEFLHSILPMEDALGWLFLGMIIIGSGIYSALFSYKQRHRKIGFGIIIVMGLVLLGFPRSINFTGELLFFFPMIVMFINLLYQLIVMISNRKESISDEY